jgi:hypothetical protein
VTNFTGEYGVDQDKNGLGLELQKFVERFMISPEQAEETVAGYTRRYRKNHAKDGVVSDDLLTLADRLTISKAIISRYATYSAALGAGTAAPGIIPGWGTALMAGGAVADLGATIKLQCDMTLCLVTLYRESLSRDDQIHLAMVMALAGSAQQFAAGTGKEFAEKAAAKLVLKYLQGPTLQFIKMLFKKVAITFTQKWAAKAIPFGIGVGVSAAANYALTQAVGRVSRKILTGPA